MSEQTAGMAVSFPAEAAWCPPAVSKASTTPRSIESRDVFCSTHLTGIPVIMITEIIKHSQLQSSLSHCSFPSSSSFHNHLSSLLTWKCWRDRHDPLVMVRWGHRRWWWTCPIRQSLDMEFPRGGCTSKGSKRILDQGNYLSTSPDRPTLSAGS